MLIVRSMGNGLEDNLRRCLIKLLPSDLVDSIHSIQSSPHLTVYKAARETFYQLWFSLEPLVLHSFGYYVHCVIASALPWF